MNNLWKIAVPSVLLMFTASACGEADQGAPEAPAVEEAAPGGDAMEGMMEDAGEAAEDAMEDAGEAMEGAMEDAGEAVEGVMEDAEDKAKGAMEGMSLPE